MSIAFQRGAYGAERFVLDGRSIANTPTYQRVDKPTDYTCLVHKAGTGQVELLHYVERLTGAANEFMVVDFVPGERGTIILGDVWEALDILEVRTSATPRQSFDIGERLLYDGNQIEQSLDEAAATTEGGFRGLDTAQFGVPGKESLGVIQISIRASVT